MNLLFFLNIGLFIVCIFSCVDDKPKAKKYLYTSHTRICNAENGWSIKKELEKTLRNIVKCQVEGDWSFCI